VIISLDKTLIRLKPFEQFAVCTESVFWTFNCLFPSEVSLECFHQKPLFSTEERMTWTSWMTWEGVNYQQMFFEK